MRNFQGSIFIRIRTYREIFKSVPLSLGRSFYLKRNFISMFLKHIKRRMRNIFPSFSLFGFEQFSLAQLVF